MPKRETKNINVPIDYELHNAMRKAAIDNKQTIGQFIEECIRDRLEKIEKTNRNMTKAS